MVFRLCRTIIGEWAEVRRLETKDNVVPDLLSHWQSITRQISRCKSFTVSVPHIRSSVMSCEDYILRILLTDPPGFYHFFLILLL